MLLIELLGSHSRDALRDELDRLAQLIPDDVLYVKEVELRMRAINDDDRETYVSSDGEHYKLRVEPEVVHGQGTSRISWTLPPLK